MRFCHFASWNMPQHQFCHLCSWNYQVLSLAILLLLVKRSISSQVFYGEIPMWIFSLFFDFPTVHVLVMTIPHLLFSLFPLRTLVKQTMCSWEFHQEWMTGLGGGRKLIESFAWNFLTFMSLFITLSSFLMRSHFLGENWPTSLMRNVWGFFKPLLSKLIKSFWIPYDPVRKKIGQFPRRYLFLMRLSLKTLMS